MKKYISILFILSLLPLNIGAQNINTFQSQSEPFSINLNIKHENNPEKVSPTYGFKLDRPIYRAEIEGSIHHNVIVELDVDDITVVLNSLCYDGVKITVKDSIGNKIYNERFDKSYLYAFSDGTLQIGKGMALHQAIIYKKDNVWLIRVRKMGLY